MVDFEKELHQPSTGTDKLNKKKRAKVSDGLEVQSTKKIRLCKVADSKLNKKKQMDQWMITDVTPDEIAVVVSNSCPDQSTTSADLNIENVINSTTRKDVCT